MGRLRSLILLAPALLAACGDQGPHVPAAIVVTPTVPRVPLGGTLQLNAAVVDADGRAIEDEPITFLSAEPEVVTVSDGGLLTSVGSLDTVTITATGGGLTTELDALVVAPPSSLTVAPRSLTLAAGTGAQIYIIVTDEQGDSIPDPDLVLETDNAAVAWVGVDGGVQAWRSGLATLFITSGEQRVDVHLTVTP
jgi:uncharacterized protein YjdB